MKPLFLYSILFIFFTFTKEKISYKNNIVYNEDCDDIGSFKPGSLYDYGFNAEYCRLKDPKSNPDSTTPVSEDQQDNSNEGGSRLRSLKENHLEKDICCYISILDSSDNWNYLCGKITALQYNDDKIPEYINELKENENFKEIKIDCFSKKLDFMINILILSLIYLI